MELDDVKVDNTKKIICNNYAYRDDNTNPIYLTFDSQHAHFEESVRQGNRSHIKPIRLRRYAQ